MGPRTTHQPETMTDPWTPEVLDVLAAIGLASECAVQEVVRAANVCRKVLRSEASGNRAREQSGCPGVEATQVLALLGLDEVDRIENVLAAKGQELWTGERFDRLDIWLSRKLDDPGVVESTVREVRMQTAGAAFRFNGSGPLLSVDWLLGRFTPLLIT